ncbi:MAG TPA: 50S ribosomal protein L11 methyltransferase [Flavisolibacter sp.]|nr:50S ribosomal protein L11 methyltransferase [Flavisolibacter sp.]
MKHIQLEIIANEYQQEELIALLDDYHPSGFEQTDESLKAYFQENEFQQDAILKILEGYPTQLSEIEEQNWNAIWEQNFHPVVVEDFCAVRAHFHEPMHKVAHEIIITPKMSFGTGHHATTYMMIQQMRHIEFKNKSVFDFGTGTGILAILAEKIGASAVTAIDVDDWSIENARENFERNGCSKIEVSLSSILPDQQFDIVLANINRNVILGYMEQLPAIVNSNGCILFSGLLAADEAEISNAAQRSGFSLTKRLERGGWISLLVTKKP